MIVQQSKFERIEEDQPKILVSDISPVVDKSQERPAVDEDETLQICKSLFKNEKAKAMNKRPTSTGT
jgi:hypothetical protein